MRALSLGVALAAGLIATACDDAPDAMRSTDGGGARDGAVPPAVCTAGTCTGGQICVRGVCADPIADADGDGFAASVDCNDADSTLA